jgi:hypothetical protein
VEQGLVMAFWPRGHGVAGVGMRLHHGVCRCLPFSTCDILKHEGMAAPRNGRLLFVLPALAAVFLVPSLFSSGSPVTLLGRLDPQSVQASASPDQPLGFVTAEGSKYQVAGDSISNAQLRDGQLIGREWELVGSFRPDGRFDIVKLFTIKDGKRYRVTYYCEICNIVTHEPGRCMCCQGPTELREVPDE